VRRDRMYAGSEGRATSVAVVMGMPSGVCVAKRMRRLIVGAGVVVEDEAADAEVVEEEATGGFLVVAVRATAGGTGLRCLGGASTTVGMGWVWACSRFSTKYSAHHKAAIKA
jgi:hypothetical protein